MTDKIHDGRAIEGKGDGSPTPPRPPGVKPGPPINPLTGRPFPRPSGHDGSERS